MEKRLIGSDDKIHGTAVTQQEILRKKAVYSPAIHSLLTEGGINFFRYIKCLGLSGEPDLIVLSSKHHYFYDETDLKRVRVLVNLKKLNSIKYLDLFLETLFHLLPKDASFIAYYSDIKSLEVTRYHWFSRLLYKFKNFLYFEKEHFLDENKVSKLLKKNGLTMANVMRMNGLTYFSSQSKICKKTG